MKPMLPLVRDKGVFVLDCLAQAIQIDCGRFNGMNHGFSPLTLLRRVAPPRATLENLPRSGAREIHAFAAAGQLRPKRRSTAPGNKRRPHGRAAARPAAAPALQRESSVHPECGPGGTPVLDERP